MMDLLSPCSAFRWPLGAKLWLKLRGYSPWPVLMWSAQLCRKKDFDQLLATYKEGAEFSYIMRCDAEGLLSWYNTAAAVSSQLMIERLPESLPCTVIIIATAHVSHCQSNVSKFIWTD